jgi:hypothetical protein
MPSLALEMVRRIRAAVRLPFVGPDVQAPRSDLIFRLRAWPRLPEDGRTAEVYRMLSVMSNQPVNRHWLLTRFALAPQQLDALLQHLVDDGSVEVIDPTGFARG